MSLTQQLKSKILDFIKKPVPVGMNVVEQSIPIPFFGDIERARFATISLNPSYNEFLTRSKSLLSAYEKRFVDRECLSKQDLDTLTPGDADAVFKSLKTYFQNIPYKTWFNWLERCVGAAIFNASYYDGTMVNLDIYPWATKSKWSDLNENIRNMALRNYSLLTDLLLSETPLFDCIYINGSGVKNQLESVCRIKIKETKVRGWLIYHYRLPNGTIMIGSNKYIQNAYLSTEQMAELQDAMKEVLQNIYNTTF